MKKINKYVKKVKQVSEKKLIKYVKKIKQVCER